MSAIPAIDVDGLTVVFDGTPVLSGFALAVMPHQKVTVTGRSGAGKSTLVNCLLGFRPPDAGTIRIQGDGLDAHSVWRLRTRMAYVAQEPELGTGRVRDIMARPFEYKANAGLSFDNVRARELLESFLLSNAMLDKRAEDLSGGEKQRVALAIAVMLERPILLLDEASSALDARSRAAVRDYIEKQLDIAVLNVSHDPEGFCFDGPVVNLEGERP